MQHPLEIEIRDHLFAYLANEITLHNFEDWFFAKTWNVDKLDEPSLLDLVYQIKLNWAEYSDEHLSEKDFRRTLLSLAHRYTTPFPAIRLIAGTSSKNLQFVSTMHSGLSAGIKSSVVYG